MLDEKKIVVVMPAYNAARTLRQTYEELPFDIVDQVLLVDDSSSDETVTLARELNVTTFQHEKNLGYGRNQKTCYREALKREADIVIMLHPDYQYSPKLVTSLAGMIASGHYDVALGSRILGVGALKGGMPRYKYISNRFLTAVQNLLLAINCRSIIRDSAPSRARSLSRYPSKKTATIFFSITKCLLKRFTSIIGSARFPVRPSTLRKHPRSVSSVA